MHAELVELPPQTVLAIRDEVAVGELGAFLPVAYAELETALATTGHAAAGPLLAWYHSRPGAVTDVSAAVALSPGTAVTHGRATTRSLPGGPALGTTHRGAYAGLPHVWMRLEDERRQRMEHT